MSTFNNRRGQQLELADALDPRSCPGTCRKHPEHVYILCYGRPVLVSDRDYRPCDPAANHPISHYVGHTRQVPIHRIRSHGARSGHFVAQIRPGTEEDEERVKRWESCPKCDGTLWYFCASR